MKRASFVLLALAGCNTCPDESAVAPPPGSGVNRSALRCTPEWPECSQTTYCATVDPGFTAEEQGEIAGAFRDWEAATQLVSFASATGCHAFHVAATTNDDPWWAANGVNPPARGYTDKDVVHVNLDWCCGSRVFNYIIRHETGHELGLPHSTDMSSIMYPYYLESAASAVTTQDVEEYAKAHLCCDHKWNP